MAEENKGFFKGLFKKLGIGGAEEPAETAGEQSVEEQEQQERREEKQQEAAAPLQPPVSAPPAQAQSAQPVVTPASVPEPSAPAPRQVWTEPAAPAPAPVSEPVEQAKPSFFDRLKRSLSKTHETIIGRVDTLLLGKKQIDTDTLEELEEILITADLGVKTTVDLIRTLEQRLKRDELQDGAALKRALKEEIQLRLLEHHAPLVVTDKKPFVIMVIGVNGVGKTTTIGKLAARYAGEGKKVLLAAADTFRAAAAEQLETWAKRVGADIVRHKEGADPSAVVFDACKAAIARGTDVLIIDTAGRMHTKVNLMEEMKKIRRVLTREIPDGPHETLLVLDAATGQNALSQAKLFKEAADVTGVVLTKLDGSAKGGIVVAVCHEYALPVRFIGVGESVEDLRAFDPVQFVDALFQ
ncbi:signal recognition particle-docking protein FtsY [Geomonas paludis]|uniref:Signal recognition particle receptor FtsY n=1 Tax=Geomonas paludis TaxID=2740185 RepID=A0A6V8N1B1_9BACT|nr:signal recognition particle-docking protein FtsY [Geomonas paludis]UPU36987.1 signal recognition particle-docking protein FtsY [Geomonas paludis]GFO66232.1 signal recognition particle receptor FtsY [Geomonas paludis]